MSAEDNIFEDPWESHERCLMDNDEMADMIARRLFFGSTKEYHLRTCTKCNQTFEAQYPCACPECGGWTNE